MKFTLTPREQQTLAAALVLAAVVLWVYSAYIIGPLWRAFQQVGQQVRSAQDELRGVHTG